MKETVEQQRQKERVRIRDGGLCLNCDKAIPVVHHIVSRNLLRGKRTMPLLWALWNMCLLCDECHVNGNTRWMRSKLLHLMAERYPEYAEKYQREPEFASRIL